MTKSNTKATAGASGKAADYPRMAWLCDADLSVSDPISFEQLVNNAVQVMVLGPPEDGLVSCVAPDRHGYVKSASGEWVEDESSLIVSRHPLELIASSKRDAIMACLEREGLYHANGTALVDRLLVEARKSVQL